MTVERIRKNHVAVVTDRKTHFIAKLFPPQTAEDPECLLNKALDDYRECASLHVYRAIKRTAYFSSPIMLTEYIGTGRTVADAGELDGGELADELGAVNAADQIHWMGDVHADLAGRNMVQLDNRRVVIVDFGYLVLVKDGPRRFSVRRDGDVKQLRTAFEMGAW